MNELELPVSKKAIYIKRISGLIILLAIAALFLFSAAAKIVDIKTFEWAFLDLGLSMKTAGIAARVTIGLETMLALFLVAHIYLKRFTYPAILAFLGVMTLYLVYLLIVRGGDAGNCGCFGRSLYMSPLQAILKNIVTAGLVVLLYFIYPIKPYKHQDFLSSLLGMAAICAPFVLVHLKTEQPRTIDFAPLYKVENAPQTDLRHGRHVVAFMSLTCPHCRKAAKVFTKMQAERPDLPVFLVIAGPQEETQSFFKETGAINVPHILYLNHADEFRKMAGDYVPAIFYINNGRVEREVNYMELSGAEIRRWAHF